jgi:two-component system sensor histidine kinase RegB
MAVYAWRIGQETRRMSMALTAAELVLAREQRLSALDGLAAAAAHQLGTPLSTIALVAKELEREIPENSPWREDATLLRTQAARCREILRELTAGGGDGQIDHIFSQMQLSHILEEVVAPLRSPEVEIEVRVFPSPGAAKAGPEPIVPRNPGLIHGLGNLVENAVDFARSKVRIEATWTQDKLRLSIADDGPGFHPAIINHLGEPYVTKRERSDGEGNDAGMGLGFFIAKTLFERSGAIITASNKAPPQTGSHIVIEWPRARLEAIMEAVPQPGTEMHASVH